MPSMIEAPDSDVARENRARIAAAPPLRRSPWSVRQRLVRIVWNSLGRLAWALFPSFRSTLLRGFGATVGRGCRFGSGVEAVIPWNLRLGNDVDVGDRVILYSLGTITIGDGVVLDYRCHLCAGSHDIFDSRFPQTRPPIAIGAGSLVGIDAYVGPGVTLGSGVWVHPRASVYRSVADDGVELRGNPARVVSADGASHDG
ncbi:MAG: colanic acid biosynthesis acetyltransferase WcaF [Planctomycetes bacterium]|nr:colanic acid biosynthesis acetyltransferase WcaF [Planctomycetota bacterium]